MYKYEVNLYWSQEDDCYIAEVPELAGCMADGETMEKALENLNVIIAEWMETAEMTGKPIPEPKGKREYA
jgi:predicted RNase H-like HicB family nuclease